MDVSQMMYTDPALIDKIVGELKSQGTFDQFRKECIADVDTKPAYQNLHQRVETTVTNFLEGRAWRPDLNKNQLRDSLRKHIHEMGFLEAGVERIVDQVVNPKVNSVFMPQVEDVVYRVQGIPKPDKKPTANSSSGVASSSKNGGVLNPGLFNNPPPFLPGLSFLPPALQNHMQKAPTLADLLPTDLDPVSPESSKDSGDESEMKEECDNSIMAEESDIIQHHDDSMESQLSGISDLTEHGSEHIQGEKPDKRKSVGRNEANEDSQLSKVSSTSKFSCESTNKFQRTEENDIEPGNAEEIADKSSYPGSSVMQYGDQFGVEEEVAITDNNPHEEVPHETNIKEEPDDSARKSPSESVNKVDNITGTDQPKTETNYVDTTISKFEPCEELTAIVDENSLAQSEDSRFSGSSDNKLHIDEMKDFNSQSEYSQQHEDEQSCMKTSSEGFLSEENSKANLVVENVVEASEEARHGFDDSQDALERPPLPPASNFSEKPPVPPPESSSEAEDRQPLPPSDTQGVSEPSTSPSAELDAAERPVPSQPASERLGPRGHPPLPQTPPLAERLNTLEHPPLPPTPPVIESLSSLERPPLPPTPPIAERLCSLERPPLPPSTPPLPPSTPPLPPSTPPLPSSTPPLPSSTPPLPSSTPPLPSSTPPLPSSTPPLPSSTPPLPKSGKSVGRPPLPPTPPSAERLGSLERPPLPPTPPVADKLDDRPPLPPTPPLAERLERPPMPLTPQPATTAATPPPKPEEEFSRDSNVSPSYDESAIPRTPRWEPQSPGAENDNHKFPSFDFLGISDPSKIPQSFIPSSRTSVKEQEDESQSGSEEMQLAWSPLSTHGDAENEDSKEKHAAEELNQNFESSSEKMKQDLSKDTLLDKQNESEERSDERQREAKKEDRRKTGDSDKHRERERERDRMKDGKSKERRKEDDRSHKESSSSSKKYDERSSKYRENHDRKDSSSKSRHDDRNRSDKDRERHSSSSHHHRSDDKRRDEKRDDKDRSSSSKHKSSRSDERHRHRDRDRERKNSSSGSSNVRHDDKGHEKSEDRTKSSSKSHSSDRRDQDRKERDLKDKEKKYDKDKERSRKDSSRHDDKKKEKEREKVRKDRSSNMCRPNNERRTPDPDSTNGFGSNNQSSPALSGKDNQHQDSNNRESSKNPSTSDSNSKSSDSSQNNNMNAEITSLSSPTTNQSCPSSLPFKKRPLVPESDNKQQLFSGQLILKIKKLKKGTGHPENTSSRRMRALRRLESRSIRNLDNCPKFSVQVTADVDLSSPETGSPTQYLESEWPTKSDDNAFLAYVQGLEQSKSLSGLSDFSESDSEEEEILNVCDLKNAHGLEGKNVMFSLSLLTEEQASKLSELKQGLNEEKGKGKLQGQKVANSNSKARNRSRRRKSSEGVGEVKRRRVSTKEIIAPAPLEQKSRRARKPNKRYSNDEFTSHFDYEENDSLDEDTVMETTHKSYEPEENDLQPHENQLSPSANYELDTKGQPPTATIEQAEKENKLDVPIINAATVVSHSSKSPPNQNNQSTYTWNRDSCNSNSEDETDNANNESDLIGTALKNLMMESGLGGPDEASESERFSSTSRSNTTNLTSGINHKSALLSGVKRVGLSRNYKGNKKFHTKPTALSCSDFSLPPSPDSDVSSSFCDKGSIRRFNPGSHLDAVDCENTESIRKTDGRVKQHYSSDDLYKPRPPLRFTSKRRQAVSEQNGLF